MKRVAGTTVAALLLMVVATAAASGKTPSFRMTVSTTNPVPGETVTIEVTLDPDFPAEDLHGLLGLFPPDAVDEDLQPLRPNGFTPIELPRIEEGRYQGSFTVPTEPGSYVIVPFPGILDYPDTGAYPDPIVISVQGGGLLLGPLTAGILGIAALAALAPMIVRWHRWRRIALAGDRNDIAPTE